MKKSKAYSFNVEHKIEPLTIYKAYKVDGEIKVKKATLTDSRDIKYRADAWYETKEAALEYYHNHNH